MHAIVRGTLRSWTMDGKNVGQLAALNTIVMKTFRTTRRAVADMNVTTLWSITMLKSTQWVQG